MVGNREPLEAEEVVIHVPNGTAEHVRIVETDDVGLHNEITVQLSKNRRPDSRPVLGVIVK